MWLGVSVSSWSKPQLCLIVTMGEVIMTGETEEVMCSNYTPTQLRHKG